MSKHFRRLTKFIDSFFPRIDFYLKQTDMRTETEDYLAIVAFFAFYGLILFLTLGLGYLFLNDMLTIKMALMIIAGGIAIFFGVTQWFVFLPRVKLLKKSKELERYLLFAIRHLFVKVNSGVTLFNGLVGIAYGDYGAISTEFRKAIKEIELGVSEEDALGKLSINNPSIHFRKFIWQLTNSMRAGTDIADTLRAIIINLQEDQKVEIQNFGARLSPIALMYMMLTIIFPTLGITFLIIFSSLFTGLVPGDVFILLPVLLVVINIIFINIIRGVRPNIEV